MPEQPQSVSDRLESWKAIAAYLNRDARTVMRWEKTEGLPVHRQRHLSRSSVYAFPHELDAWRANRRLEPAAPPAAYSKLRPLAVAAMLAIGILSGGGGEFTGPVTARQAGLVDRVLSWPDEPSHASEESMSPNGRYVAYFDETTHEIAIRDVHDGHTRILTTIGRAKGDVDDPVVSNDGKRVAFDAQPQGQTAGVFVLPVDTNETAPPKRVLDQAATPKQWSADDRQILVTLNRQDNGTDIGLVSAETSALRVLATVPSPGTADSLALSPDGKYVTYDQRAEPSHRQRDLWIVRVGDGVKTPLLSGPTNDRVVAWSPDGRYVVFISDRVGSHGEGLWALPVRDGAVSGDPILLKGDFRGTPVSLTRTGTLLFEQGNNADDLLIAPLDADGAVSKPIPQVASHDPQALSVRPRWSSDGQWFTYTIMRAAGPVMAMRNVKTGVVKEIPLELAYVSTFDVSPDGQRIVCRALGLEQHTGVFIVDTNNGAVVPVAQWQEGVTRQFVPQFTPDGRSVTYVTGDYHGHNAVVERDLATGAEKTIAALPPSSGNALRRSPDGRYVLTYLETSVPARTTLRLFDVVTGEARELFHVDRKAGLTTEDGVQWMPDSRAVVANVRGGAENARELWWIPTTAGQPHRLDIGLSNMVDSAIAVDAAGQHIAFVAGDPLPSKTAVLHYQFRLLEHFLPSK